MAKYRITSIPQARYGGVFNVNNRRTRIMKGRKNHDFSTDQEEPMVEVQNVAQPSYWNEMQSPIMTGKQCPPGKYDYNGQCLTESELRAAWAEEQKGFEKQMSDRKLAHEQKIQESRQRLYDALVKNETTFRENKWNEYQNTYKNSKKSDKIEPFDRIPLTEFNKERENQFKQARFLVNKNKETGFAELYPIEFAYDRIINNGYQADQFKNYWGLDPKQVKEQLGPLMDAAKQQYDATLTNEIVEKAIKEGKSIEKVIESLPASRGTKEGLKEFEKPATELIDKALDYMVDTYAESNQTDPSKISKDQNIFFSNDPITAWEKKYHDHDLKYYSDKSNRGGKAFNEQLNKSKVNPDIQYNNYDDQMAQQRDANRRSLQAFTLPKAIQAGQNAENEDFMKAFGEFQNNITAPVVNEIFKKAVNALPNDEKPQFINDIQVAPNLTMQRLLNMPANKSGQTYSDLLQKKSKPYMNAASIHSKYNMTQGDPNRELTTEDKVKDVLSHPIDAAYYWLNPREEMWGDWNMSYDDRLKAEDKFDVDLGTMSTWTPTGVLTNFTALQAMNPFKIGMNLREGYDEGNFLPALGDELWDVGSHIGFMNGLNAIGKGAGFFKPMLTNIFNNPISQLSYYASAPSAAKNAYENYQKGDYTAAAIHGLGAMAPVLTARNTIKTLNSLKTPGTIMTKLFPESRYTFTYNAATPGSGIFIGNANTANPGIGQPKFQSITKPINTLSKNLGFGEFNINKVNPGWRVPEQPMSTNLLGYSKGGSLPKASFGQIVKAGTKLTKAAKPAIYLMESPGLRVTVPEFESLVNENLAKGLGIKKIDDQLKVKINPVTESSFDLSGNPLLRLDMSTYVGNNLTGDIGITRFDKGQHGIPTLEDQLIFMKERDYPFGLSDRFNLMGTGVSGEFNKAITNSLQQVGLNPLVSSGMHTQEGRKRWDDLTKKGHATQLHKHFYMLHKNGGVALELTQKEIDQYVKDGYIVEDE